MSVANPFDPSHVSDTLVRERTPDAVLAQHLAALNACDSVGLMQQYPDGYELRLPGGTVVKGRTEAAATFAGFVEPLSAGGLCGITFSEISRQVTGGTLAVTWEADAPFLAEPYQGSDAYITDDGLMVSMVSTFDGAAAPVQALSTSPWLSRTSRPGLPGGSSLSRLYGRTRARPSTSSRNPSRSRPSAAALIADRSCVPNRVRQRHPGTWRGIGQRRDEASAQPAGRLREGQQRTARLIPGQSPRDAHERNGAGVATRHRPRADA